MWPIWICTHVWPVVFAAAKELGLPLTLRELGATEEMLEDIAASTVLGGGYKFMDVKDTLDVLKAAY